MLKGLVACECSGVVRDAFRTFGHDFWSCDLQACDADPQWHIQGDAIAVMQDADWDIIIAHPPCTYLSVSGLHWNGRVPGRADHTEEAYDFVLKFWQWGQQPGRRLCIENPIGLLSTRMAKPTQIVQPHQFGDDASKATCLWLIGLPPLVPFNPLPVHTLRCRACLHTWNAPEPLFEPIRGQRCPACASPKIAAKWSNQTKSGQNKLGPSEARAKIRAQTYPGLAAAMAATWGNTV